MHLFHKRMNSPLQVEAFIQNYAFLSLKVPLWVTLVIRSFMDNCTLSSLNMPICDIAI